MQSGCSKLLCSAPCCLVGESELPLYTTRESCVKSMIIFVNSVNILLLFHTNKLHFIYLVCFPPLFLFLETAQYILLVSLAAEAADPTTRMNGQKRMITDEPLRGKYSF